MKFRKMDTERLKAHFIKTPLETIINVAQIFPNRDRYEIYNSEDDHLITYFDYPGEYYSTIPGAMLESVKKFMTEKIDERELKEDFQNYTLQLKKERTQ